MPISKLACSIMEGAGYLWMILALPPTNQCPSLRRLADPGRGLHQSCSELSPLSLRAWLSINQCCCS